MALLTDALTSGRLVELIVLLMLLEAGVLLWLRRRSGGAVPPLGVLAMIAAGVCLMLALRAALVDAGVASIATWLGLALLAHAGDLAMRWQRPRRGRSPNHDSGAGSAPQ